MSILLIHLVSNSLLSAALKCYGWGDHPSGGKIFGFTILLWAPVSIKVMISIGEAYFEVRSWTSTPGEGIDCMLRAGTDSAFNSKDSSELQSVSGVWL